MSDEFNPSTDKSGLPDLRGNKLAKAEAELRIAALAESAKVPVRLIRRNETSERGR